MGRCATPLRTGTWEGWEVSGIPPDVKNGLTRGRCEGYEAVAAE
jgi:hypothetical protein